MLSLNTALSMALIAMMFAMGLGLCMRDFYRLFSQPCVFLSTALAQLLLLPIIALLLAMLMELTPATALGLLLVALSPSGSTSNFFCKMGQGNAALSVSLTAVISLVTVISLPVILFQAAGWLAYDTALLKLSLWDTIKDIASHTLLPVIVGMVCRHLNTPWAMKLEPWVVLFSSLLFFIVIILLWWQNWAHIRGSFAEAGPVTMLLLFCALSVGILLGYLIGADDSDRFTMMMEVGIQNGALAFFIALNLIQDVTLLAPATVYTVAMVLVAVPLLIWRKYRLTYHIRSSGIS